MSTLSCIDTLIASLQKTKPDKDDDSKSNGKDDSLRITPEILSQCIDLKEYRNKEKYPYIHILPTTKPSSEFRIFDNMMMKGKIDFLNSYKNSGKALFSTATELQNLFKPLFLANDIRDKTNCKCIEYKKVPNVKCFWIEYEGASITNGVILVFHGAAYVIDFATWCFAECELLSKLTGMICIAVQYKKAPKFPLPTPINDAVAVYNHFLNEIKISSSNIVLMGDSSGGGLTLLTLQQLSKTNIKLPSCAILQSPWCYLNYDAEDIDDDDYINKLDIKRSNYKYDSNLNYPVINIMAKMALGLLNENLQQIKNKLIKVMDEQSIYNPIFNDFKGLNDVSMYFMVGATEALLFDTLDVAKRAYDDGCKNIICEIQPFMLHSWMVFAGKFNEADYTIVKIADFILKNIDKSSSVQDIPKSEYQPDPGQIISV